MKTTSILSLLAVASSAVATPAQIAKRGDLPAITTKGNGT